MNSTLVNLTTDVPMSLAERKEPAWFTMFSNGLLALDIVLILSLNSMGLYILHRFDKIQETTKVFMASLTVADINIALFCAAPVLMEIIAGAWVLGEVPCLLWGIMYPAFLQLSIFSLTLLSIDRFIAIVYSLRYNDLVTPTRCRRVVAVVWVASLTEAVILFGVVTRCTVNEATEYRCDYNMVSVYQFSSMTKVVFSQLFILTLYLYILHVARDQARRIAAHLGSVSGGNQAAPVRVSTKSATTVIIITGSVIVCWSPSIIMIFVNNNSIPYHYSWNTMAKVVFFCNSWINVAIYYLRNAELRASVYGWAASMCCHRN